MGICACKGKIHFLGFYTYSRAAAGSAAAVAPRSWVCCAATVRRQSARLAAGSAPFSRIPNGRSFGSLLKEEQYSSCKPAGKGGTEQEATFQNSNVRERISVRQGKERRAGHSVQHRYFRERSSAKGGSEQRAGHSEQDRTFKLAGKGGKARRAGHLQQFRSSSPASRGGKEQRARHLVQRRYRNPAGKEKKDKRAGQ